VNAQPHLGHAYTTIVADALARWHRLSGDDVHLLTGTDEHGLKIQQAADAKGVTPQEFADSIAPLFAQAWDKLNIQYDDFIRTTETRHERQVQAFIERLQKSGALYKGSFEGWYDEGQEEYYTETRAKELDYKSPISGRPLTRATEQNYYFKLSSFQKQLEDFFAACFAALVF
jgi:methionyl-tRNA synthetase